MYCGVGYISWLTKCWINWVRAENLFLMIRLLGRNFSGENRITLNRLSLVMGSDCLRNYFGWIFILFIVEMIVSGHVKLMINEHLKTTFSHFFGCLSLICSLGKIPLLVLIRPICTSLHNWTSFSAGS